MQAVMRVIGEERLKAVLQAAVEEFRAEDGSITIAPNYFKYVVAVSWDELEVSP